MPFASATVTARGTIDLADRPHAGVTVFSAVELAIAFEGPATEQAAAPIAAFRRRCPVYGSLAVASGRVAVHRRVEPGAA